MNPARTAAVCAGDIRFQYKYGFYGLYLLFSLLYLGLLFSIPESWREKAAVLLVFSDPAAMGLYFMGAIVLFEKSERVINSLAVSPVTFREYTVSKLFSIAVISTAAGLLIGIVGGGVRMNGFFVIAIFSGSCLFSAIGLLIASQTATLNAFILATVPVELLINLPAIFYLFGWKKSWLLAHPGAAIIELCTAGAHPCIALFFLLLWSFAAGFAACCSSQKMFRAVGGGTL